MSCRGWRFGDARLRLAKARIPITRQGKGYALARSPSRSSAPGPNSSCLHALVLCRVHLVSSRNTPIQTTHPVYEYMFFGMHIDITFRVPAVHVSIYYSTINFALFVCLSAIHIQRKCLEFASSQAKCKYPRRIPLSGFRHHWSGSSNAKRDSPPAPLRLLPP